MTTAIGQEHWLNERRAASGGEPRRVVCPHLSLGSTDRYERLVAERIPAKGNARLCLQMEMRASRGNICEHVRSWTPRKDMSELPNIIMTNAGASGDTVAARAVGSRMTELRLGAPGVTGAKRER